KRPQIAARLVDESDDDLRLIGAVDVRAGGDRQLPASEGTRDVLADETARAVRADEPWGGQRAASGSNGPPAAGPLERQGAVTDEHRPCGARLLDQGRVERLAAEHVEIPIRQFDGRGFRSGFEPHGSDRASWGGGV